MKNNLMRQAGVVLHRRAPGVGRMVWRRPKWQTAVCSKAACTPAAPDPLTVLWADLQRCSESHPAVQCWGGVILWCSRVGAVQVGSRHSRQACCQWQTPLSHACACFLLTPMVV